MTHRKNAKRDSRQSRAPRPSARQQPPAEPALHPDHAVAVVGLACSFPQAADETEFWSRLCEGHDCITEVPPTRFDIDAYHDPRPGTPGKIVSRHGGFLDGIDAFDADFFGIAPREAGRMDPQQRLLLETAAVAVEDAGLTRARLAEGRTGVFVGSMGRNYWDTMSRRGVLDIYANAGTAPSVLSGRLSYAFDLHGPSLTVDTACSSSLTAVHLACQSLRSGESTTALVGGVNLVLVPEESITFSDGRMLAPDGRCKFASASADGFVRSEGVGVVVLKPLRTALEDGDAVRAVIRGSAVVNDGQWSDAMMAPAETAQRETLRAAYADAGVDPARVDYVEAHGTGTAAGDPVELRALSTVLGEGREDGEPLLVGSVKSNIGHAEGAAGIAGLIKAVLVLEHGLVPPSLHSAEPTPAVDWQAAPVRVPQETTRWAEGERARVAGVSSFGISGTNAHVVLSGYRPEATAPATPGPEPARARLLALSSHRPETLHRVARDYRDLLMRDDGEAAPLRDVCFSAATRREHRESRLTLVGSDRRELAGKLDTFLDGEPAAFLRSADEVYPERAQVVFVFPGQGSQWVGMGRELFRTEPEFRRALEECDAAIRRESGWSVVELVTEAEEEPEDVAVVQPALWAMEVALAAVWRSWGLEPDVVVGHSMGEVAAACASGALSIADGAAVICRRSALAKEVSGRGAMASVELSAADAARELEPYEGLVSVAAVNGPSSTILSGDGDAMREVLVTLQKKGVFCRLVRVDFASHGPQVEPLREPLLTALKTLDPRDGTVPMYSTVLAEPVDGSGLTADYWARNLRQPVLFGPVVERLLERGPTVFVEVSPHPILVPAMREYVDAAPAGSLAVGSTRRHEPETACLLDSLAAVHLNGQPLDLGRLFEKESAYVRLPGPAWERQRYWFPDTPSAGGPAPREKTDEGDHPLLGRPVPGEGHVWEGPVDLAANAYLRDHQVQGVVIIPGTAYVEMVAAAARAARGTVPELRDVTYHRAIYLRPEEAPPVVRVAITPAADGSWSFEVSAREAEETEFSRRVTGGLDFGGTGAAPSEPATREAVTARCTESTGDEFYRAFAAKGNQWLGAFQGVRAVWRGEAEALARIEAPSSLGPVDDRHLFHPALLDACGHTLAAAIGDAGPADEHDAFVLGGITAVRLHHRPDGPVWSHAVRTAVRPDAVVGTVQVRDEQGLLIAELEGVTLRFLVPREQPRDTSGWVHDVVWRPAAAPAPAARPDGYWLLFGGADEATATLAGLLGGRVVVVEEGTAYERPGPDRYRIAPDSAEGHRRLLDDLDRDTGGEPCAGIVHGWSRTARDPESRTEPAADVARAVRRAEQLGCHSVLHLVRALDAQAGTVPRLFLVTEGAQHLPEAPGPVSVGQAMLWGFGRSLAQEYRRWTCTLVDLEPGSGDLSPLAAELLGGTGREHQIAFRGGRRYVPRLVPRAPSAAPPAPRAAVGRAPARYALRARTAGLLDSLERVPVPERGPGPGEVEIRTTHSALNYRDVLTAMGAYPGLPEGAALGWECAGVVTRLGEGAAGVRPGDEVVALAEGALASHVVADARLVARVPSRLTAEEALTLPAAYLTAYHGLHELAGLAPGERVLIHSATGGVGLAAVRTALWRGAEVFATAGSPQKRALLKTMGIRHVADSRSTGFADAVLDATRGEGVDVVLNSLSGEAISRNLSLLAPYGRYVEMSKKDLLENSRIGLLPFSRSLTFHAMDLVDMLRNRPRQAGVLFDRVLELVESHAFEPLPYEVYEGADAESAFRRMARAQHVGKVLLRLDGSPETAVPVPAPPAAPAAAPGADWQVSGGSCLITGGLGGIGTELAKWLIHRGARDLILVGRSPLGGRAPLLKSLERDGARVTYHAVDVADEAAMRDLLREHAESGRPPVRGVLHAAGVIDLAPAAELDPDAFSATVRPKVTGAWTLHRVLEDTPLDFFALFSSASAVLGSPMLGAYAAANAALDALAHHRRARGLPALSVNWGFWSTVGMVARYAEEHGRDLAPQGMDSFTPHEAIGLLQDLLAGTSTQATVLATDWQRWRTAYPDAARDALLTELVGEEPAPTEPPTPLPKQRVAAPEPRPEPAGPPRPEPAEPSEGTAQGPDAVREFLTERLAKVLALPPQRLSARKPLNRQGLDSLMATEVRGQVQRAYEVTVPLARILGGQSLADLTEFITGELEGRS
ncbi:type I polyketide synthase [Streptomyces sp. HNM0574]|uniref:type I polyketide synthase n=1 Tax=Streptomyces sp. HNM0574 TaxID=2714954 RepID=UPI001469C397|nr:type I polyketide synthase [Streptomyces sp. HNM0574]NLU68778.1 SDR family NAD(P)-dependent oxidoreductase [Streptomyces sp. HNM0574]